LERRKRFFIKFLANFSIREIVRGPEEKKGKIEPKYYSVLKMYVGIGRNRKEFPDAPMLQSKRLYGEGGPSVAWPPCR
jgi:hypothetical protein